MNIGVTGHRLLPGRQDWDWVDSRIVSLLQKYDVPFVAWSSLAPGTDQHFAELATDRGAPLHVVQPFETYDATFDDETDLESFKRLMSRASMITTLPSSGDRERDYFAAGEYIVESCSEIIAVWDGMPAKGLGGTGDIVKRANALGVTIHWLNPVTKEYIAIE